ncbi:MAG: gamma-glutamyltransferase [Gemmatimonadota bacterium]|nr:gamma-glutamyltransferase [Gemmatimonadota bacterium]
MDRRKFVGSVAAGSAAAVLTGCGSDSGSPATVATTVPTGGGFVDPDPLADFHASGRTVAVATTAREATDAAFDVLERGGNAADAYIAAAVTQAVVEVGLVSIGGAFGMTFFDAATGQTASASGGLGPAAAEPYDFDRFDAATLTGRAMPIPGYIAGVHAGHTEFGRLEWGGLFDAAIGYAREGVAASDVIVSSASRSPRATRFPEGQAIWMRGGRYLRAGERLIQSDIGRTLQAVAEGGPEAFYEGEFAKSYVARAGSDGGLLTLDDMSGWRDRQRVRRGEPEGDYRGHQVWAPTAGLLTYALHLSEAADLRGSGPAASSAESVYRQMRIIEEVFLSTTDYDEDTHARFVDPAYARERVDFVIESPMRDLNLDALFNTSFIVVRDADGNCAWGTHSINTPTAFGAGIVVDGVYAAHAISRAHVYGSGGTANGIGTNFALFRDGRPRAVFGSPGFGFVHGPYQAGTAVMEWGLEPMEAVAAPRFGFPSGATFGQPFLEGHYEESVYEGLEARGVPHVRANASVSTGLVGALVIDEEGVLHAAQDPRRAGFARAV